MALLRCTGEVRKIDVRTGTNERGGWAMTTVRVLVGDADFTDVTWKDGVSVPNKGDMIDVLVDVYATKAGFLRIGYAEAVGQSAPKARPVAAAS